MLLSCHSLARRGSAASSCCRCETWLKGLLDVCVQPLSGRHEAEGIDRFPVDPGLVV